MAHGSPPSVKWEMAVCDSANPPDPSKFGMKRALSWIRGGYKKPLLGKRGVKSGFLKKAALFLLLYLGVAPPKRGL